MIKAKAKKNPKAFLIFRNQMFMEVNHVGTLPNFLILVICCTCNKYHGMSTFRQYCSVNLHTLPLIFHYICAWSKVVFLLNYSLFTYSKIAKRFSVDNL